MSKSSEIFKNIVKQRISGWGGAADLARKLAVKPSNISQLLGGDNDPQLSTLDRVAAALGLEPWELLKPADPPAAAPLKTPAQVFAAIAALGDARLQAIARMDEADWSAVDFVLANAAEKLSPAQADDTQDKPARGKHRA